MSLTAVGSDTPTSNMNPSINNVSPPRIAPRCVTGACHPANRKSMDWSESCGLIAFGSHGAVVVVDSVSLQVKTISRFFRLHTNINQYRKNLVLSNIS